MKSVTIEGIHMGLSVSFIVGVSNYQNLPQLPGCLNDVINVEKLLLSRKLTDDTEINVISVFENTKTSEIKDSFREFVAKYKEVDVSEAIFYFTGHGGFEDEVILCGSDFNEKHLNTTAIKMSEVDTLLRALNADLTVKIIDSCSSGQKYIKDKDPFDIERSIRKNVSEFNNVVFMFSSLENQSSFADKNLSAFTKALIDSIGYYSRQENKAAIYYSDISSYIGDFFKENQNQKPRFVSQSSGTEKFTDVTNKIKEFSIDLGVDQSFSDGTSITSTDIIKVVKNIDYLYCEEQEIKEKSEYILKKLKEINILNPLISELYTSSVAIFDNLKEVPNKLSLARRAYEKDWSKRYFLKVNFREVRTGSSPIETSMKSMRLLFNYSTPTEPYDIETTNNLAFQHLKVLYTPKYRSIKKFGYHCCVVHSDLEVIILTTPVIYKHGISWENPEVDPNSLQWQEETRLWRELLDYPEVLYSGVRARTEEDILNYLNSFSNSDSTIFLLEKLNELEDQIDVPRSISTTTESQD